VVVEAFSGRIRVGGAGGEPISPEHVSRVLQEVTELSEVALESMGVQPAAKFAVFSQDSRQVQRGGAEADPSSCSSLNHMAGVEEIPDSQSSSKDHPTRFSKQTPYPSTICQPAAAPTSWVQASTPNQAAKNCVVPDHPSTDNHSGMKVPVTPVHLSTSDHPANGAEEEQSQDSPSSQKAGERAVPA
jgi:hypothetical protein